MPQAEGDTSTRAQILAAALDLFRTRGYDATSLRGIADRLGLTKAALYYHFRAKEDLLTALLEPFRTKLDALLDRGATSVPEFLSEYVDLLIAEHDVVSLFAGDPAVFNHAEIGPWAVEVRRRLSEALLDRTSGPADQVRASCAMYAVGAVVMLPRELAEAHRDQVVAAALAAFSATP